MKQTNVGVSVIIFNQNDEVLIGKRKGSHGAGLWAVPGGHIEFWESYGITCNRELKEEIGTDLNNLTTEISDFSGDKYQKVGFSEDFFVDDNNEHKHYTTLYFTIKVKNEIVIKNMEPGKCEGWEWINIKNLPNPEYMFCDCHWQIKKAHNNE